MKFTCTVDINLSRSKVRALYDNPQNLQYWQDDIVSFKHQKGEPGTVGAQSLVNYKHVELTETIVKNSLPEEFHGLYEGKWGKNTMSNYFEELSTNETRWKAEVEFLEFSGFMMKVMKLIFPNTFKKQTQKWMDQFKAFAESRPNLT